MSGPPPLRFDCVRRCGAKLVIPQPDPPRPLPDDWHEAEGARLLGTAIYEQLLYHALFECPVFAKQLADIEEEHDG